MWARALSIYLFFTLSPWMLVTISSFQLIHNPNPLHLLTSDIKFHEKAVKHYWGEEQEETRCVGTVGETFYEYHPSDQCRSVYDTIINQKCAVCGAVRERRKYDDFLLWDQSKPTKVSEYTWSELWELENINLLACSPQSSEILYEEKHEYVGDELITRFKYGNIDYALKSLRASSDDDPLVHIHMRGLSNNFNTELVIKF
jgi:hypothetical protein